MGYVINHKLCYYIAFRFRLHCLCRWLKVAAIVPLSSVTDDESIYDSDNYLSSEESDADCLPYLTEDAEVLPYLFKPEASPEPIVGDSHVEIEVGREEETYSCIHNTNW